MRRFWADERGTVTAEFAIGVPAVLLVLGLVVGALQLSAERVALTALAGDLARLEARGDGALAEQRLARYAGTPSIERSSDGRVLCVEAEAGPRAGLLAALTVTGSGCAAVAEHEWAPGTAGTADAAHAAHAADAVRAAGAAGATGAAGAVRMAGRASAAGPASLDAAGP